MMRPILVMKDVHAVQQPHAAVEHPVTHQESTAPTNPSNPTSTTHHSESSAPLLNEVEHSQLEEEKVVSPQEEESITIHIGDNTQHMPTLLFPTHPTNTPTSRHRPRQRTRRF